MEKPKREQTAFTTQDPRALARMNDIMQQAGPVANEHAVRVAWWYSRHG